VRLVTIQPHDDGLAVIAVNDAAEAWAGQLTVRRYDLSGEVLAEHVEQVRLAARDTVTVALPAVLADTTDAAGELLRAELAGVRAHWFFTEPRDSSLTVGNPQLHVERTESGYTVRVTVDTLTRDLALLVDKVDPDALVDDMLVTLLPGESTVFTVTSVLDVDPAAFSGAGVLRSTNQLVRP
jgi:beta-mannosidase